MLKTSLGRVGVLMARAAGFAARFHKDDRANVLAVVALMLIPLIGALAMGSEVAMWNVTARGMQNAADSAVVAAATAGYSGNTSYAAEGYSVAARYNFAGTDHTASCPITSATTANCVSVLNAQPCPDGTTGCYKVTISSPQPLLLTQALTLIGWNGDTHAGVGGAKAIGISASAMAEIRKLYGPACILSLNPSSNSIGIQVNGGSKFNVNGCLLVSDSNVTCNGAPSSGGAGAILYVNTNKNGACVPSSKVPSVSDPYSPLPAPTTAPPGCSALTAAQAANLTTAVIASLPLLNGSVCLSFNGDVNLVPDVSGNVTTPSTVPTQIYINNGNLTALKAAPATLVSGGTQTSGGGVTVLFSGTSGGGLSQYVNLNIANPLSGTWKGFTIVDPIGTVAAPNSISYSGSTPTWNLSGIAYFPYTDLQFNGIPGKANSGFNCFVLVTNTVIFNGTATIYQAPTSQCTLAGVTPPQVLTGFRTPLVS